MYSKQFARQTPNLDEKGKSIRERRCFVTCKSRPTKELVRFVLGPDNCVVPDVTECLPGRGFWLTSSREIVNTACNKNLFSKAAGGRVVVREALADKIEEQLLQRCLCFLGMARRASEAVAGFNKVISFLKGNPASIVLCACDGGNDGRNKVVIAAKNVPVIKIFSSAELGSIFGRERTVYVAVAENALARHIMCESERLAGFRLAETL
ncbi:MAG: RNA-binding protein [Alphaproteobacteria bacterium]